MSRKEGVDSEAEIDVMISERVDACCPAVIDPRS
jgi:hypothetical protein